LFIVSYLEQAFTTYCGSSVKGPLFPTHREARLRDR